VVPDRLRAPAWASWPSGSGGPARCTTPWRSGYTSIVVLAQIATAQPAADPGDAAERLGLIEEVARENLAEARAVVAAFAPVALESATLVEALQRLAERFGRETGIATRLDTTALGEGPAPARSQEIVLLRGAQEALTNVRRHAAATAVVRVLVLTTYDTDADIVRAVEAGATGYLLKDTPLPQLADAVRAAARAGRRCSPRRSRRSWCPGCGRRRWRHRPRGSCRCSPGSRRG
jgi:CheY-like chemotaxis protein